MLRLFFINSLILLIHFHVLSQNTMDELLIGNWEYGKIKWNDRAYKPEEEKICEYRDELQISQKRELEKFAFINESLFGYRTGYSSNKICIVDPETFEVTVEGVCCGPDWIQPSNCSTKIIRRSYNAIIEYNIVFKGKERMKFKINRVLEHEGWYYPTSIVFHKIQNKENQE